MRREGIYKRKSRSVTHDPFTSQMKATLKAEQDYVYKEIQTYLKSTWPTSLLLSTFISQATIKFVAVNAQITLSLEAIVVFWM